MELRGSEATAGRLFQAAGYRTGFVGKWHLGGIHEIREYTADIKEIMEKEKELVANFGGVRSGFWPLHDEPQIPSQDTGFARGKGRS